MNRSLVAGADAYAFDLDQLEAPAFWNSTCNRWLTKPMAGHAMPVVVCGGGFTGIGWPWSYPAGCARFWVRMLRPGGRS